MEYIMDPWRGIQPIIMVGNHFLNCVFFIFFNRVFYTAYPKLYSLNFITRGFLLLDALRVSDINSRTVVECPVRTRSLLG